MFDRLAEKIYRVLGKFFDTENMSRRIKRLEVCTDAAARDECRKFYCGIIKRVVMTAGVFLVIVAIMLISRLMGSGTVVLNRPGYGADSVVMELETEIGEDSTAFSVEVIPVEYPENEIESVFDRAFEEIDACYLGENSSADEVRSNLNLISRLDDLGLDVDWSSSDSEIVETDGTVKNEDEEMDLIVELTASLECGGKSVERTYPLHVLGAELTVTERAVKLISEYVLNTQKENSSSREIELPRKIDGYAVTEKGDGGQWTAILVLGVFAMICICVRGRVQVRNREKYRSEQLMLAYPELVDKLTLYLGAGITVKKAFERIAQTCSKRDSVSPELEKTLKNKNGIAGKFHKSTFGGGEDPLVKEVRYTLNEIRSGVSESDAYCNMGHRINLPVYIKLMSLLAQNIRKGTKDIIVMMAGEEQSALLTKKEMAKKKGEEAGTKLLFPMIVLLGIVMVIVISPAIMNF